MAQSYERIFRRITQQSDSFPIDMFLYDILSDVNFLITYEELSECVFNLHKRALDLPDVFLYDGVRWQTYCRVTGALNTGLVRRGKGLCKYQRATIKCALLLLFRGKTSKSERPKQI